MHLIFEYLNDLQRQKLVKDYHCFWIGNIIRVDTYQSVADEIAKHFNLSKKSVEFIIKDLK